MIKCLVFLALFVGSNCQWVAHTTIPVKISKDLFSAVCIVPDSNNLTQGSAFQWLNGTGISPVGDKYIITLGYAANSTLNEVLASNLSNAANWTQLQDADSIWQTPNAWYAQIMISKIARDEVGGIWCANRTLLPVTAYAHVQKGFGMKDTKNVIQGDNYNLTCEAYGYPLPEAVAWYKNGAPVALDTRVTLPAIANKTQNATLSFAPVEYVDDAEYTCYTWNEFGLSDNVTMAIRVKDRWAALWPFVGIVIEVIVLCAIILLYEKRQQAKMAAEEDEKDQSLMNDGANEKDDHDGIANGGDEVRQRPITKS